VTDGTLSVVVNGQAHRLASVPDDERLLDTLRWRLGLKGTKEGCRTGGCGACTVLVNGEPTLSCLTLSHEVPDAELTTIEGVGAEPAGQAVQAAFLRAGAVQCGYCTPGFVVTLTGLLRERSPPPPVEELLAGLNGNLCRCTGYATIQRAVRAAREALR
jgi:carbon-monoxide dehydrogenase small subunit